MYEGAEQFQAGELIASIRRMVKSICYDPQSRAVTLRLQDGKGSRAKTDG
jgi:hypothetical protein